MTVNAENPKKKPHKTKIQELINGVSKVSGYKAIKHKSTAFLYNQQQFFLNEIYKNTIYNRIPN